MPLLDIRWWLKMQCSTWIGFLFVCLHWILPEVVWYSLLGVTGVNDVTLSMVTGGQVTLLRLKVIVLEEAGCARLVQNSHCSLVDTDALAHLWAGQPLTSLKILFCRACPAETRSSLTKHTLLIARSRPSEWFLMPKICGLMWSKKKMVKT